MKIFWLKQSQKDIPDSLAWLHVSEKTVLSTFKFPKKKNDWLLGRWTAKNAVRFYLKNIIPELSLNEIEIISAEDGAPEVYCNGKALTVIISLSHRNGSGFCVVSNPAFQLGCDLEKVEKRSPLFVNDYFTQKEQTRIASLDQVSLALWVNLVWSAKESALKALRLGLRIDTRKVEVNFSMENENTKWNAVQVTKLDHGSVFYGFWKTDSEFVYTIVSEIADIEILEIADVLD